MHLHDKILLKKKALIACAENELKNIFQTEHTRYRSIENFLTNMTSGLIVCSFLSEKPFLHIEIIDKQALRAFVYVELKLINNRQFVRDLDFYRVHQW